MLGHTQIRMQVYGSDASLVTGGAKRDAAKVAAASSARPAGKAKQAAGKGKPPRPAPAPVVDDTEAINPGSVSALDALISALFCQRARIYALMHATGTPWTMPDAPGDKPSKGKSKVRQWCDGLQPSCVPVTLVNATSWVRTVEEGPRQITQQVHRAARAASVLAAPGGSP